MKTLFIDSSRKSLSVALVSDKETIYVSNINSYSKHSNFLMNEIINVLGKTNNKIEDVDNIVVLNGPGSFTGVRVGVTIAKTLCYALNKDIYKLTTLKALALNDLNDIVVSCIYDKDDSSYVGIYKDGFEKEAYMTINNVKEIINDSNVSIICMEESPFVQKLHEILSENNKVNIKIIDDYDYGKVIHYALSLGKIDVHLVEPVYLKKIDAEKKKYEDKKL